MWFTASFVFYIGSSLEGLYWSSETVPSHTLYGGLEKFKAYGVRAGWRSCSGEVLCLLEQSRTGTTTRTTVILSEFADIRRSEARTEVHSEPL